MRSRFTIRAILGPMLIAGLLGATHVWPAPIRVVDVGPDFVRLTRSDHGAESAMGARALVGIPKTTFRAGAQGLPGWKYRVKDHGNNWNSFEQDVYVLMMTNRSDYFGYEIVTNAGVTLDRRTYDNPFRGADNSDVMATFLQIVAGAPQF